ncbi:hypothetical protein EJ377_01575 [Chryseobacterium arthrosphaerae]|uniref:Uncharacterized protein n=1 Tax=Chryseobacterium arthrosphaerae TaxID=651561 RepID=A0A432DYN8_9FLAO|nr:hypothetical protein EJ377_01575 [Chryseobacterium arthrosphaerae]
MLLLFVNFQITQAVSRHDDATSSDSSTPSATLFISEGTVVSGMEKVYIPQPKKRRQEKKLKEKSLPYPSKENKRRKKIFLSLSETAIGMY